MLGTAPKPLINSARCPSHYLRMAVILSISVIVDLKIVVCCQFTFDLVPICLRLVETLILLHFWYVLFSTYFLPCFFATVKR